MPSERFQTALFDAHSNKVSSPSDEPQAVCTYGKAGQRSRGIGLNRHNEVDGLHFARSAGLPRVCSHSITWQVLAQKRAYCVENARKVFNLAVLFALQARFCPQNLTRG